MDPEPFLQHGAAIEREMQAHANSLSTRVSTWALAGNGAALLLCFNALAAHHICHWAAIRPLATLFLIGLAAAFGSVLVTMRSFELSAARMMKINAGMRKASSHASLLQQVNSALAETTETRAAELRGIATNAEAEARKEMAEVELIAKAPEWERQLARAGTWALGASVLAFGIALAIAVWSNQLAHALCASAP